MQSLCEMGLRRGVVPGQAQVPSGALPALPGWRQRVMAAARGPWGRPLTRAGATVCAVVFLSWLGARSAAQTAPPQGEPDPKLESLVTMAAAPVVSSVVTASSVNQPSDAGTEPPRTESRGVLPDGRIVLNTASVEELCRLKGIGPARAKKIVALRERLGRYRSVRQLLRVRGIGPLTLQRLRPKLVLDAPEASDAG